MNNNKEISTRQLLSQESTWTCIEQPHNLIFPAKTSQQEYEINAATILTTTAAAFGVNIDELKGTSRKRPIVVARQVAMYVIRELTDLSYPAIGKAFGDKDHTTVMHSVEKIESLMSSDREIYNQVSEILTKIRSGY